MEEQNQLLLLGGNTSLLGMFAFYQLVRGVSGAVVSSCSSFQKQDHVCAGNSRLSFQIEGLPCPEQEGHPGQIGTRGSEVLSG